MADNTQKAQPLTEAELIKREEALVTGENKLKKDREDFEAEKKAFENSKTAGKTAKQEPGLKFTFQGVKKKFKDAAPKQIRYDGKVWEQKELIDEKNEDAQSALADLVTSNSNLFENA